jgi:nucleoside phosphorylase
VLLHLAAFAPELAALDSTYLREVVGVGLVEAALGTQRVLAAHRPAHVVLVGTAGAYEGSRLAIGDVVAASRIVLAAPAGGALPDAIPSAIATDVALTSSFAAKPVIVATTLAITTDDDTARALERATGAAAEHLEAFAVARACELAGIPFTAVLGIANIVGARGRAAWREHHERAAAAACAVVRNPTRAPTQA